jgi:hypothetical protein
VSQVAQVDAPTTGPFVRALIGGPARIHLEAVVDAEVSEADFEVLLRSIRRAMGDAGHMSMFARTLSWSPSGTDRRLNVTISSRAGRTTVTIQERLGSLIGGIFGGVGGGVGGGGSGGVVAIAQKLFGSGSMGFVLVGYLAAVYGLARTIYSVTARKRERRHRALLDELVAHIRAMAPAPGIGPGDTPPKLLG